MPPYTLKYMAEAGYVMGLSTIGEVASHMSSHYDAYFLIEKFAEQWNEFAEMVKGHEDDSIDLWLTDHEKRLIDEEMETAMAEGSPEGGQREIELREATDEEIKDEEEGEQENKHF
jgi:hypothetical protein